MPTWTSDVVIVGGCGRVGLPFGLALADRGFTVVLLDHNESAVAMVSSGTMPFAEAGADELLGRMVGIGRLEATSDASAVANAEHVVIVVGTPIRDHLDPAPETVPDTVLDLREHLRPGQHLMLRSTVFPGVTARVERLLAQHGLDLDVSFCPERIAEGQALTELRALPQIVSARTDRARQRAEGLFDGVSASVIPLEVEEAELAKLFTNTWRYIKFAAANQLYMIANDFGQDFDRIRSAMALDYPRAADIPSAGLAAGPCLLKDTMQLAAFNDNRFTLGHASMTINEGLPLYLVSRMERRVDLASSTVGILGMAFKAECDDIRSSLSYKLKRILRFKADRVLTTDPYVRDDDDLVPLDRVLRESDALFIATPHRIYSELGSLQVPVIDVWNLLGRGVQA